MDEVRIMQKFLFSVFLGAIFATNAAADISLLCKIKVSDRSWIMPEIVVREKSGRVVVADAMIMQENGGPLSGELVNASDKRRTFAWTVRNVDAGPHSVARFRYRLTYFPKNGKATVQARPLGFENVFNARGRCSRIKS